MPHFSLADLDVEFDTPRRAPTSQMFARLAREAQVAGEGSQVWERYQEACELMARDRRAVVERDFRVLDEQDDNAIRLGEVERLIRSTVAQTLEACAEPPPEADSAEIEHRLSSACHLIALLERIEDFRHDFLLLSANARLGDLDEIFREQSRKQRIRLENRDRLDMILPNVFKRFAQDFTRARHMEQDLRRFLKEYEVGADLHYDTRRFDQPIATAFNAALALEVRFEDRLFADAPTSGAD